MKDIEKIKNHFTDLLQMCKFQTLTGELKLSWFDKSNIVVNNDTICIDFNLDDTDIVFGGTYGYLEFNYLKDQFCLTIEHNRGTIIKNNLDEDFASLHNFIEKL